MKYILSLDEVSLQDKTIVGGKASSLAQLSQHGVSVPAAFVITTAVYTDFFGGQVSRQFLEELETAWKKLGSQRVAVRSSAPAEDSGQHSWAGQLDTSLNITHENLLESIQKCWQSLSSQRAQSYADQRSTSNMTTAVIVQTMVESEISGVIFTVDPITTNPQEMLLEAVYGLGETLVQGEVTPANYRIEKSTGKIVSHLPGDQVANHDKEILDKNELTQLTELALKIEQFFGQPQDIEWAKKDTQFYILQARPITTL